MVAVSPVLIGSSIVTMVRTLEHVCKVSKVIQQSDDVATVEKYLRTVDSIVTTNFCRTFVPGKDRTLLMQCCKHGRLNCLKLLLSIDKDKETVNLVNQLGFSALHYACFNGHTELVTELIRNGATTTQRNYVGETPSDSAAAAGWISLAAIVSDSDSITNSSRPHLVANNDANPLAMVNSTCVDRTDSAEESLEDGEVIEEKITEPLQMCSRVEAARYIFTVSEAGVAKETLIGQSFNCLASVELKQSKREGVVGTASRDDLVIGRSRTNHVQLDDLSVSKRHAVLSYFEGKGFILRDLGSKYGTSLNGEDVSLIGSSAQYLKAGDTFKIGKVSCTVSKKVGETTISQG